MFVRTIGTGIGVLLAMTAHQAFAVEPAQHTVEWYRTHQQ